MKKLYSLVALFLLSFTAHSQEAFITTWKVGPPLISTNEIIIPTVDEYEYNYTIDFGDGSVVTNVTGNISHSYSTPGPHTVTITGQFPAISMAQNGIEQSNLKLQSIEQWGDIQWQSMYMAFNSCKNLIVNATDIPDLSQVTNMAYMFHQAEKANPDTTNWDVSNVTNMNSLFYGAFLFNQPLNNWDVSNVTDMELMLGYSDFNQPLDNWDTTNVTTMRSMFAFNDSFNQPLNDWDVSSVTNMSGMFQSASAFNQPLSNWNTENVTDMSWMFAEASTFNQDINSWNVSNVTTMLSTFYEATLFNQPLNNWDVSSVTTMYGMFYRASSFNQPIFGWDVSSVIDISNMFSEATAFNQPLNDWNTISATDMSSLFNLASSFNQPLDNWNTSAVSNMSSMFYGASSFNQSINAWDVSSVTSTSFMFGDAITFNQPLDNWNVENIANMDGMFIRAMSFDQPLDIWQFSPIVTFQVFLDSSGYGIENYDALLEKFVQLGYEGKELGARELEYCNAVAHEFLIDDLGWTIVEDALSVNCSLGMSELAANDLINLYPVPANDSITIDSSVEINSIEIVDLTGKTIQKQAFSTESINIAHLATGHYFMKMYTENGYTVKRFIKL